MHPLSLPTLFRSDLGGPGKGDGICLDAEGAIWCSVVHESRPACWRVGEDGEVLQRIELDKACFACMRSEEHTSELQSRENLVCRLLLEKKEPPCEQRDRAGARWGAAGGLQAIPVLADPVARSRAGPGAPDGRRVALDRASAAAHPRRAH